VIGCAFQISNSLGVGFLKKVHENALAHELRKAGLGLSQYHPMAVTYDGVVLGEYMADLFIENTLLAELKTVHVILDIHAAQCLNYLKATGLPLCLLPNLGTPRPQIRRIAIL